MQWLSSLLFASLFISSNGNLPLQSVQNQTQNQVTPQNIRDESERFEQTYQFNSNGKIEVSNINGSITVEAWDRNEIKLEAVKTADTKDRLEEVQIKINAQQEKFLVETDYGSWQRKNSGNWGKNGGNLRVEFHLWVPKNAILDQIETVNGSVLIKNMHNFTKASAVNGEVSAINLRGSTEISTVNGTTNAEFDSLQSGGKITLSTVNGRVNLTIPSDADATIKADTINGGISNDFGLPIKKGQFVGRDLYGKLGNGDVKIRLNSVNGALSIKRNNDGREIKQITNLLSAKNDEINDDEFKNIELKNIAKDAEKQAKFAMEKMQVNLENFNINGAKFEEYRQNLVESQKAFAKAQKTLNDALHQNEGSKEGREERIQDAKQSFKEAQQALKEAERELEKFVRSGIFPVVISPVPPVAPVTPITPTAQFPSYENYRNDSSYSNLSVEKTVDSAFVKGIPKITVEGLDSDVVVSTWDKSEVSYSITKISNSKSSIDYEINKTDSEVSIKAIDTSKNSSSYAYSNNNLKNRIELIVPRKSNIKIVGNDGNVRVDGVSGDLDLNTSDGKISVRDSIGKLRIKNSDGNVRVIGFKGELDAKTSDGNFYLEGDFSRINASSSDGNFILTLPENTNAEIFANVEEIETSGISVTKKSDEHWQIGNGEAKFTFNVSDGSVKIRGINQINN